MVFMTTLNDRSKTIPEARAAAAGPVSISAAALAEHLARPGQPPHLVLDALIADGLGRPPLPGHGATLERWRMLAMVAGHDLSLAKLYEGHSDAMAILAELRGPTPAAGSSWGVWCAEAPEARLALLRDREGALFLHGRKAWCSGAAHLTHALVSCWDEDGYPRLVAVALRQAGVKVTDEGWQAIGMATCGSVDVVFDHVPVRAVGAPGTYVARPGFWHGGAGVAACWYGAAQTLAGQLRKRLAQDAAAGHAADPHRLAHLGRVDVAMQAAAALLRSSAAAIDAHPTDDAAALALRCRLAVEAAANTVLDAVTRALGAAPLCRDADFARMAADLPVFLRQSHAERDLAALGAIDSTIEGLSWTL